MRPDHSARARLDRALAIVAIACFVVLIVVGRPAWGQCERQKVQPAGGAEDDFYGAAVAVGGTVAIIGAPQDDDRAANAGAVFVYRRESSSWIDGTQLLASDGEVGDFFGFAVAARGDVLIVGAWGCDDRGTNGGAAYVFRRDGTDWVEEGKLLAADGLENDQFGRAVGIDGDVAVVGAPGHDAHGADAGAVYVFRFDGAQWLEEAKLPAAGAPATEALGGSVAIDGSVIAAGAALDDGAAPDAGAARIFRHDGAGWSAGATLVALDAAGGAQFGWSVALDGDTALVGANTDPGGGARSGAAYVFRFDGGGWGQEAKLTASDAAPDDHLGHAVALDGGIALLGARWDDANGYHAGSAYVFRRIEPAWEQEARLLASDGAAGDKFGFALGLDAGAAVIGAFGGDDQGSDSGAAYAFDLDDECACLVDLNGDGSVGFADVLLVIAQWGPCPPVCIADVDGDGSVGFSDILVVIGAWGPCS
ncbi:MAG: hypothetical protein GY715_19410 [Planctomycetes bacterium]|nr:hypothetical protein [Planctomycetota bacterium]